MTIEQAKQVDKQQLQEKVLGQFTQYDINTLKQTIAAGLTGPEFGLFLNTCVATGLNPFLKQVIPVVYESQKNGRRFDIQVPVEGIEHLARQKDGWQGYELQLVCENDKFRARRDRELDMWFIEEHEIMFPRGKTMGAYCIVPRSGFKDVVVFMERTEVEHLLTDYRTQKMWGQWFNDMFKKHVKKRGLREQFGIEIDDMSDLSSGPDQYENNIPAFKQERKEVLQQEEQLEEENFNEQNELLEMKFKIVDLMEQYNISNEESLEICARRFNGKQPDQLNSQEVAAFMKFIDLEGQTKKAKALKEAKQAASYQYRAGADLQEQVSKDLDKQITDSVERINDIEKEQGRQIEEKSTQVDQQEPEEEKTQQEPKGELDSFLEDIDTMFNEDGQGELL